MCLYLVSDSSSDEELDDHDIEWAATPDQPTVYINEDETKGNDEVIVSPNPPKISVDTAPTKTMTVAYTETAVQQANVKSQAMDDEEVD